MRSSTPPWPGQELPAVLDAALALEQRFEQIADDRQRRERKHHSDPAAMPATPTASRACTTSARTQQHERVEPPSRGARRRRPPRSCRADRRRELARAEGAAGEIRGGIGDPDDRHQRQQQPRRARLELHHGDPGRDQHQPADSASAIFDSTRQPAASHAGATSTQNRRRGPHTRERNAVGPAGIGAKPLAERTAEPRR